MAQAGGMSVLAEGQRVKFPLTWLVYAQHGHELMR
jgi:hypothetical protein